MEALHYLLFLAFLSVNIDTSYCLDCYSCQNIDDPHSCNSTISCQSSQVCYLDFKGGIYSMGCANNQHCGGISGVGIVGRDIAQRQMSNCLECCSSDGCNSDLCIHYKPTMCIDDETVDCAKMNTLFQICHDVQRSKLVCPKFCGLCTLVDGSWAEWSAWSTCDVTCNKGVQTRSRTCTNPSPANGGNDCVGSASETKNCQKDPCPVHGGWSNWNPWGSCSVSCDIGVQRRDRYCNNPYPSRFGNHCYGDSRDDRLCMPGPCADGGWSGWGSWGPCSESCGGGVKTRSRSCSNPRPSLLGRGCEGSNDQVVLCNKSPCSDIKVAFTAYGTGSEGSETVIKFPWTYFNSDGAYNTSTGKFTCKTAGIYHFAVTLTKIRKNIDQIIAYVVINGSKKLRLHSDPDDTHDDHVDYGSFSLSAAGTFHLNVNDYVEIRGVPTYFFNDYNSFFTGFLVIPDIL